MANSPATAVQQAKNKVKDTAEDIGNEMHDTLGDQLSALSAEIASITESLAKFGAHGIEDIRDGVSEAADQVKRGTSAAAREVSHQAHVAGQAVKEHPVPAILVLAGIALLTAMVFRRQS